MEGCSDASAWNANSSTGVGRKVSGDRCRWRNDGDTDHCI